MILDLNPLLEYYQKLEKAMDRIFPEEITWENCQNYNYDLSDFKHPKWVEAYFPLDLIYYRAKAGKLRDSKSVEVMYQNNFNVLTQVIADADCFGIHYRKNKHKGFKEIMGAVKMEYWQVAHCYGDMIRPKKFKNFMELHRLEYADDLHVKAMCEVLQENFKCDSTGQLKLI